MENVSISPSKDDDYLLRLNVDSSPITVDVPHDTRIRVDGQNYWAWREEAIGSERRPAWTMGSGIVSSGATGESALIADLLRRAVPHDDPRWSIELPKLNPVTGQLDPEERDGEAAQYLSVGLLSELLRSLPSDWRIQVANGYILQATSQDETESIDLGEI